MKEVSTSFLSNKDYRKTILELNETNTDYIHFDVMDGEFVQNKNLPIDELISCLSLSTKKNDIHFMVCEPLKYIKKLIGYDIEYITVHYEIDNLDEVIDKIKEYGFKVGISIKPITSIESVYSYLDRIDMVLIMSVEPGKSGQMFLDSSLNKIKLLHEKIKKRNCFIKIEIDGGINDKVLDKLEHVDIVVSSSYVLNDYNNINRIKNIV